MPENNIFTAVVISGFLLDILIGDPENSHHPVRFIGKVISAFEKKLYSNKSGKNLKLRGLYLLILSTTVIYMFFKATDMILWSNKYLYFFYGAIFFYFGISYKELTKRGLEIAEMVNKNELKEARYKLGAIVGRDTHHLDKQGILKATVETMSENLSDGVTAPMFYFAIGGIPLMYLYKTVNTLDSMVGYKNKKYKDFGYFSAKTDDILNFIPARITAFLIFLVTINKNVLINIKKFARAHPSPNSGFPESAIAGAIECKLGGISTYESVALEKPVIGDGKKIISPSDIKSVAFINFKVSIVLILITLIKIYFTGML